MSPDPERLKELPEPAEEGGVGELVWLQPPGVTDSSLDSIDVCLLLEVPNIFLTANLLVAKPVGDLRDGDSTLLGKLLLSLLTRIWVTQVGVEILSFLVF